MAERPGKGPTPPLPAARTEDGSEHQGGDAATWSPRRSGLLVLALVLAVALVASALVVLVLDARGPAKPTSTTVPVPTLAHRGPKAAFQYLMSASASAQRLSQAAVGKLCLSQPPQSPSREALAAELSSAAVAQEAVARLLGQDRSELLSLSSGTALVALLAEEAVSAARADEGFASWAQDLQATGCYSAPTNDIHYIEAEGFARSAGAAAARLSTLWPSLGR